MSECAAASLEAKMNRIMADQRRDSEMIRAIYQVVQRLTATGAPPEQSHEETEDTSSAVLFRSGRSIAHLEVATKGQLVSVPGSNALYCKICVKQFQSAIHAVEGFKTAGVYKYDFSLGSQFDHPDSLPQQFRNLRSRVRDHFESDAHKKEQEVHEKAAVLAEGRFNKNQCAAARCIRTGYYVLKKSLPFMAYEDLVVLQSEQKNGLFMGDLNHSEKFMATLRTQIHTVLKGTISRLIASQPCVALMVDKVTLWKRSVDITAIVTALPVASDEGTQAMQSFVIGAPVVADASGEALSDELVGTLASVGITRPDQLASICTDGAYFHCGVPEKLVGKLTGGDPGTKPAVPAVWDHAHLLNLAEEDAKKAPGCKWVKETIAAMSSITKRFMRGKAFEALMKCGQKRGETLLHPKLWCDTRFAQHASSTMKTFLKNAGAMRETLERTAMGDDDGTSEDQLRHLKGKCWCMHS